MKKILFLIYISLLSLNSYAGGFTKGNGGNILYCPSLNQNLVLDFYEQSTRFDLHVDRSLLNSKNFYEQLVKKASRISDEFSLNLKISVEEVITNISFVEDFNLGDIDDSYPFFIPNQCEIRLAALQRNGNVLIALFYWKQLTKEQKFFLVTHEILYFNALKQVSIIRDSEPIRALNSLLLSQELNVWTEKQIEVYLNKYYLLN